MIFYDTENEVHKYRLEPDSDILEHPHLPNGSELASIYALNQHENTRLSTMVVEHGGKYENQRKHQ